MSLLKYVERLKRMDDLIKRKATGNAAEFAGKLNISQSQLFQDIKEMKQLGAPIAYCATRRSYYYERNCRLVFDFAQEGHEIIGGTDSTRLQLDGIFFFKLNME